MGQTRQPNPGVLPCYQKLVRSWLPSQNRDARRGGETWDEIRHTVGVYVDGCLDCFAALFRQRLNEVLARHDPGAVANQSELARVIGRSPGSVSQMLNPDPGAKLAAVNLDAVFRYEVALPGLKATDEAVLEACRLAGRCRAVEWVRNLLVDRNVYPAPLTGQLRRVEFVCLRNMYLFDGWQARRGHLRLTHEDAAHLIREATEFDGRLPASAGTKGREPLGPDLAALEQLDRSWGSAYLLARNYLAANRGTEDTDAD